MFLRYILLSPNEVLKLSSLKVPQLMAKAEPLPESREGKILAKEVPKLSKCQITLEFGRSHLTTNNFVEDSTAYGIERDLDYYPTEISAVS